MFEAIFGYFKELGAFGTIAQLIGVLAAVCEFVAYQQKTQKGVMLVQVFSSTFWIIHMFMLGAPGASIMNFIMLARAIIYSFRSEKEWAQSNWWYAVFIVAGILGSWYAWAQGDKFVLLQFSAMVISTIAYSLTNAFHLRLMSVSIVPFYMSYNIIYGSIAGIVTECANFVSLVSAMLRIDIPKYRAEKKQALRETKQVSEES